MGTLLRSFVIVGMFGGLYAVNAEALQFDSLNVNSLSVPTDSSGSTSLSWLTLNQSTLAPVPLLSGLGGGQGDVLSGANAFSSISAFLSAYGGLESEGLLTSVFAAISRFSVSMDLQGEGIGNGQSNGPSRTAVPIPGSFLLFAAGFAGFAAWHWRVQ